MRSNASCASAESLLGVNYNYTQLLPEIVLRSLILLIAVKNLLTRVALVAKDMRPDSGSLDEYVQAFDRRIQSVVDAHALLSQNRWDGVDLAELVRRQLAPYATSPARDSRCSYLS